VYLIYCIAVARRVGENMNLKLPITAGKSLQECRNDFELYFAFWVVVLREILHRTHSHSATNVAFE